MVKCTFCGQEEPPYKGIHVILNDGTIAYLCSSKCRKNSFKLRRERRTLKWTNAYRQEKIKVAARQTYKENKANVSKK